MMYSCNVVSKAQWYSDLGGSVIKIRSCCISPIIHTQKKTNIQKNNKFLVFVVNLLTFNQTITLSNSLVGCRMKDSNQTHKTIHAKHKKVNTNQELGSWGVFFHIDWNNNLWNLSHIKQSLETKIYHKVTQRLYQGPMWLILRHPRPQFKNITFSLPT